MPGYADYANMRMPSLSDMAARMRAKKQAQQPAPGAAPVDPNANMNPKAARLRALMGQGMSFEQAMKAVQGG